MCLMLRTNFFCSPPPFFPLPPYLGRISALTIILNYVKNVMLGRNCTAIVLCLHLFIFFIFYNISRKCVVSTLKEFEKCTSNCIDCNVNLSYFDFWKALNWKLWLKTDLLCTWTYKCWLTYIYWSSSVPRHVNSQHSVLLQLNTTWGL